MRLVYLLLIVAAFILESCKSYDYVQLYNVDSTIDQDQQGNFIYENDSIAIEYYFWRENGIVAFTLFNKLDRPVYVDWKKSSYIDNTVKLDYWTDSENRKTERASVQYGRYLYTGPQLDMSLSIGSNTGTSETVITRPERITFIPPQSYYGKAQYYILPDKGLKLDIRSESTVVPRKDKPNKETEIYQAKFDRTNSPVVFRNFITLSTTEDFEEEFYIDNEFYVGSIEEMERMHFEQYRKDGKWYIKDSNGNPIWFSDFESVDRFYVRLAKFNTIVYRR